MKKALLLSASLLLVAPINAAVYSLSGIFDNSLAANTFGTTTGGFITGTLDDVTNVLTLSGESHAGLFGYRNTSPFPATLRSGPPLITVAVDSVTGEDPGDSPLLLALTADLGTINPLTFSDTNITISAATTAAIINGTAYVHLDSDDADTAGLVVATLTVPEPSSTMLLGLASLALIGRRKR